MTHPELLSFYDLFSWRRYSTTAETLEDSYLLFIFKEVFWEVLDAHQDIFSYLLILLTSFENNVALPITKIKLVGERKK